MLKSSQLLQATLLLALSVVNSLALECNFQLTQSANGNLTRIQVGDKLAIIETEANETWKGFVKRGDSVTFSDQTGASNSTSFSELTEEERNEIEHLISQQLNGIEITGEGGSVLIQSTNNNFLNVKSNENNTYTILGGGSYATLFGEKSAMNFTHIFFFLQSRGTSAVGLVDAKCELVRVLPLDKLDDDTKSFLISEMIGDRRGGSRGFRGFGSFRGPHGGPGGSRGHHEGPQKPHLALIPKHALRDR